MSPPCAWLFNRCTTSSGLPIVHRPSFVVRRRLLVRTPSPSTLSSLRTIPRHPAHHPRGRLDQRPTPRTPGQPPTAPSAHQAVRPPAPALAPALLPCRLPEIASATSIRRDHHPLTSDTATSSTYSSSQFASHRLRPHRKRKAPSSNLSPHHTPLSRLNRTRLRDVTTH